MPRGGGPTKGPLKNPTRNTAVLGDTSEHAKPEQKRAAMRYVLRQYERGDETASDTVMFLNMLGLLS